MQLDSLIDRLADFAPTTAPVTPPVMAPASAAASGPMATTGPMPGISIAMSACGNCSRKAPVCCVSKA